MKKAGRVGTKTCLVKDVSATRPKPAIGKQIVACFTCCVLLAFMRLVMLLVLQFVNYGQITSGGWLTLNRIGFHYTRLTNS